MSWIQTYSGKQIWPIETEKNNLEDFYIEDIAHSLSMQCRFNGHTKEFFSVAQHSYMIANFLYKDTGDKNIALVGLMHDATEAYLCDVPRPIKTLFTGYKDAESKLMKQIAEAFEIDYELFQNPIIKKYDDRMLVTEASMLLRGGPTKDWSLKSGIDGFDVYELLSVSPHSAKNIFLETYNKYAEHNDSWDRRK